MDHQPLPSEGDDLFAAEPAPPPPADPTDHLLRLVAALFSSPSIQAMLNRRVEQATKFGHTPERDLLSTPHHICRSALDRVRDASELLDGRDPPRARLERALAKVEAAGAMMMATHDRIRAALAALPPEPESD